MTTLNPRWAMPFHDLRIRPINGPGQPSVMGQLIGGLLLGPSFFGLLWPSAQHAVFPSDPVQKSMVDAVSELGILMLLLLTGMETDLQLVRRAGRAAIAVAAAGVAVPFACGFALGELLPAGSDRRAVMPVFFGISGLNADLTILRNPTLAALALGLIVIASIGKFVGAFVGGTIGGLSRAESLALGCAMNARGSTEVIIASVGLSSGLLTQDFFTLIVGMAIVTTVAMPPMLRWSRREGSRTPWGIPPLASTGRPSKAR